MHRTGPKATNQLLVWLHFAHSTTSVDARVALSCLFSVRPVTIGLLVGWASACPYSSMSLLIFGVEEREMVQLRWSHVIEIPRVSFGLPSLVICYLDLRNELKQEFSFALDVVVIICCCVAVPKVAVPSLDVMGHDVPYRWLPRPDTCCVWSTKATCTCSSIKNGRNKGVSYIDLSEVGTMWN